MPSAAALAVQDRRRFSLDRGRTGDSRQWSTGDSRHTVSLQPSVGIRARFSDSGHPELSACGSIYAPTDAEGKPITFAVLGSRTHVSLALSGRRAGPMLLVSPSESSWVSGFGSVCALPSEAVRESRTHVSMALFVRQAGRGAPCGSNAAFLIVTPCSMVWADN